MIRCFQSIVQPLYFPTLCQKCSIASTSAAFKGTKHYVNRKTGRGSGNAVLSRFSWRYDRAIGRQFQRTMGVRFGIDMGIEDRILLLSISSKQRRLDDKKMKQLAQIMEERMCDVMATDETLAQLAIQITKVTVDKSFSLVNVHWLCRGEGDDVVVETLETSKGQIRRRVGEIIGISCPELKFVGDKTLLMEAEMDKLFREADYGMDYRMLSKSANTLGNVDNKDIVSRPEKVPKWLKSIREKKLEKLSTGQEKPISNADS